MKTSLGFGGVLWRVAFVLGHVNVGGLGFRV